MISMVHYGIQRMSLGVRTKHVPGVGYEVGLKEGLGRGEGGWRPSRGKGSRLIIPP